MSEERVKKLENLRGKFANFQEMTPVLDEAIRRAKMQANLAPKEVVAKALIELSKAITAATTAGASIDETEVVRILRENLATQKISFDELDSLVQDLLKNQVKTYQITYNPVGGTPLTATGTVRAQDLKNPLVQLILSDMSARNNVYLYGPAGTGKTFIAEVIADMLGWPMLTVTCNQFTSPLNLIGGQTIEGYQKGLLERAWGNLDVVNGQRVAGNVLLLDELPKLDPNTAGVMNDALAKVKRQKSIENGKGEKIPMGNCFIMATGNVKLNEVDEDYVANFKQDLSLQDRFVGSCYPILVQYDYQVNDIMKGYLYIWEYMTDMMQAVKELNATSQAFVSNRILESLRDTQKVFAGNVLSPQAATAQLLEKPKSLIQGIRSFLSLFDDSTRKKLEDGVEITDYRFAGTGGRRRGEEFRRMQQSFSDFQAIAATKNAMTIDWSSPGSIYDTGEETERCRERAEAHDSIALQVYQS
jgi:hypothetical protein